MSPTQKPLCGVAENADEAYILEAYRAAPDDLKKVFRALARSGATDFNLDISLDGAPTGKDIDYMRMISLSPNKPDPNTCEQCLKLGGKGQAPS